LRFAAEEPQGPSLRLRSVQDDNSIVSLYTSRRNALARAVSLGGDCPLRAALVVPAARDEIRAWLAALDELAEPDGIPVVVEVQVDIAAEEPVLLVALAVPAVPAAHTPDALAACDSRIRAGSDMRAFAVAWGEFADQVFAAGGPAGSCPTGAPGWDWSLQLRGGDSVPAYFLVWAGLHCRDGSQDVPLQQGECRRQDEYQWRGEDPLAGRLELCVRH